MYTDEKLGDIERQRIITPLLLRR